MDIFEYIDRVKANYSKQPEPRYNMKKYFMGGRVGFDKGGVAKVFAHLDSLSEGTEIDLNYIRKYIGDNNINASAENVFKQFDKINLKQIAGSGNETFTYGKEKRDQLTRLKNKLKIKKLTTYIPATKENLDKLDNLIKNTDLTVEKIGEKMGYENPKSFKLAPTTKNVLTKAYLKKIWFTSGR